MKIRKENKGEHRCSQTKCAFYVNGGCQSCMSCKAPPFIMSDSCQKCRECEFEEGELRWNYKGKTESELTEKEKIALTLLAEAITERMQKENPNPMKQEKVIVR